MKSYLHGNPQLKLALNDDIITGGASGAHGALVLQDYNFHECVDPSEFESYKILTINPPDGEFLVMNYRINSQFDPPFRISTFIDE